MTPLRPRRPAPIDGNATWMIAGDPYRMLAQIAVRTSGQECSGLPPVEAAVTSAPAAAALDMRA